jgi:hypothetical protein
MNHAGIDAGEELLSTGDALLKGRISISLITVDIVKPPFAVFRNR